MSISPLLEVSLLSLFLSLGSSLLAKKYISYEQLKLIQDKLLKLKKLQEESKKESIYENSANLEKIYQELQSLSKEMLSFQIKSLLINILPFFVGLLTVNVLLPSFTARFPEGLFFIPTQLSSAWIYILSYAAFNSLLAVILGTTPEPWDYAKTLAKKQ